MSTKGKEDRASNEITLNCDHFHAQTERKSHQKIVYYISNTTKRISIHKINHKHKNI